MRHHVEFTGLLAFLAMGDALGGAMAAPTDQQSSEPVQLQAVFVQDAMTSDFNTSAVWTLRGRPLPRVK